MWRLGLQCGYVGGNGTFKRQGLTDVSQIIREVSSEGISVVFTGPSCSAVLLWLPVCPCDHPLLRAFPPCSAILHEVKALEMLVRVSVCYLDSSLQSHEHRSTWLFLLIWQMTSLIFEYCTSQPSILGITPQSCHVKSYEKNHFCRLLDSICGYYVKDSLCPCS